MNSSDFHRILDVRIVGGSGYEGRVEVYYNGTWGTVCHYGWSMNSARVLCRQLGFEDAVAPYQAVLPNFGKGKIWLKNIWCTGNESSLLSCPHGEWGDDDYCIHNYDVGVQCKVPGGKNKLYIFIYI